LDILKGNENKLPEEATDFITTISDSFGISNEDYDLLYFFIYSPYEEKAHNSAFMIVLSKANEMKFRHHLFREHLSGSIVVLYVQSIQTFFFRHEESDDWLYLNGKPIIFNRVYLLEKGSAIRCPKIQTIHYSDILGSFQHAKILQDVQLTALNIEFGFKKSDNGIKKFNFQGRSGQLVGIMGGSGVGKSTLLQVLNGTLKPNSGRVLINGIDIYENKEKIKGIIGFMPQDDFLVEELTVFENLYFNARFCFSNLHEHEIISKVDSLLKDFDLFEIRDLKVGTPLNKFISGGQRKRLNIALELIREPFILFVDEPTSGLSSNDSEMVMELLKQQTYKGKLVIINIHQPSTDIFKMFDNLLVLDKGGRPVYYGNTIDSLVYFKSATQLVNANESECIWCGNLNPEQLLQIIETREIDDRGYITNNRMVSPEDWYQLYLNTIDINLNIKPISKPIPKTGFSLPGSFMQFILYFLRNIKSKFSDKQYLFVNILEAPALAFILGFFTKYESGDSNAYIFSENLNIPAFLFMSVVVALFLGMMGSAEEIFRDAKLLKRESFLNLSRNSYINSKVVYLFIVSAIQMLIYVLLSYYILEIHGMKISHWIVLFSTSCLANMIGLNLSAGLRSIVAIYILIPLLLIPQILLSGVIVKFDKLNHLLKSEIYVPAIGDVMASRWAYEALAVRQFKNNRFESLIYNIEKEESNATFCCNYWIPELLNRVGACELELSQPDKYKNLDKKLTLLKTEFNLIAEYLKISPFEKEQLFQKNFFNDSIALSATQYLKHARNISSKILSRSIEEMDNKIQKIEATLNGHENMVKLKQQYNNLSLADQLLNKNEPDKIIEYNGRLYRRYEPVFYIPENNFGRAQFYAPYKSIGNYLISTFWFNIFVVWLMTILLYFTLILNLLERIMNHFYSTNK